MEKYRISFRNLSFVKHSWGKRGMWDIYKREYTPTSSIQFVGRLIPTSKDTYEIVEIEGEDEKSTVIEETSPEDHSSAWTPLQYAKHRAKKLFETS